MTVLSVGMIPVTEDLSAEEADDAVGIALSVWGITPAKAKKIVSRDLGLTLIK